eukprot:NODE_571_length_5897_cov_0.529148.p6 type:complete len:162 gc:universal NODE_571_length_5897_cov_0.529148:3311-2826(-)
MLFISLLFAGCLNCIYFSKYEKKIIHNQDEIQNLFNRIPNEEPDIPTYLSKLSETLNHELTKTIHSVETVLNPGNRKNLIKLPKFDQYLKLLSQFTILAYVNEHGILIDHVFEYIYMLDYLRPFYEQNNKKVDFTKAAIHLNLGTIKKAFRNVSKQNKNID